MPPREIGKIRETVTKHILGAGEGSSDHLTQLRQAHRFVPPPDRPPTPELSADSLRNTAKSVLDGHTRLLSLAHSHAKRLGSAPQIIEDLDTICKFQSNDPTVNDLTIKAAMSRLANRENYDQRFVTTAANLIKTHPEIQPFYKTTPSPDKGKGHDPREHPSNITSSSQADVPPFSQADKSNTQPESGPSQDTGDIAQKRLSFLDNIPKQSIMELKTKIRTKAQKHLTGGPLYIEIREACNKIGVFYKTFDNRQAPQMQQRYPSQTKDDVITAALKLRTTLNDDFFKNDRSIAKLRDKINQCYQDAGLS